MDTLSYPYKPKPLTMLLSAAFFVVCGLVLANSALTNDRGLTLNGVIRMGEVGATVFYWALTVFSFAFVGFALYALLKGSRADKQVILTPTSVSAPQSNISSRVIELAYSDIYELDIQKISGQQLLNLHYPGGKLSIPRSMLPNKKAFEELTDTLAQRLESSKRNV